MSEEAIDYLEPEEREWLKTQPPEAAYMIQEDVAFVGCDHQHEWKGVDSCKGQPHGMNLCLAMSDTFSYACADAEPVSNEELPEVVSVYKRYGHVGLICWSAKKRNEDPVIEYTEDPVYQQTWQALYGDLKVEANYCNTKDPRWSSKRLNLKPWSPIE